MTKKNNKNMYRVLIKYADGNEEKYETMIFRVADRLTKKLRDYMQTNDDAISVALYEGRRLLFKESKPKLKRKRIVN